MKLNEAFKDAYYFISFYEYILLNFINMKINKINEIKQFQGINCDVFHISFFYNLEQNFQTD